VKKVWERVPAPLHPYVVLIKLPLADATGQNTRMLGDFRQMGLVLHTVCPEELIA